MAQINEVSLKIPANELIEIKQAINTLDTKLLPHLVSLSSEKRMALLKMGSKNLDFIQKCYDYCISNPELVPNIIDMEEFRIDIEAMKLLRSLQQLIAPINDQLDDTLAMSGSEAMSAALLFYQGIKTLAKNNVPKSPTIFDDLSKYFPGRVSNKAEKN